MGGKCWAGRKAFNGGNPLWRSPCKRSMEPTHVVTDPNVPDAPIIELCTFHYEDALGQGLISEPDPTPQRLQWAHRFRPEMFRGEAT